MAQTFYINTTTKEYSKDNITWYSVSSFKTTRNATVVIFNEQEDAIGDDTYSNEVMKIDVTADTVVIDVISNPPGTFTTAQLVAQLQLVFPKATGNAGTGGSVEALFDEVPTQGSTNLMTSGSIFGALRTSNINDQTASYTLVITDAGKLIRQNVASANNVTVPLNSSVAFSVGTIITISNTGAGQVTFVPISGVTINSADNAMKLRVRYSTGTLIKTGTDMWLLTGDIIT